jgi:hypothetical protein
MDLKEKVRNKFFKHKKKLFLSIYLKFYKLLDFIKIFKNKFLFLEYFNIFFFRFLKQVLNIKNLLYKKYLNIFKFFIVLLNNNDLVFFIKNFFKNILIDFFSSKDFFSFKNDYFVLLDIINFYFFKLNINLNLKNDFFFKYLKKKLLNINFFKSFIFSDSSLHKLFNF